VTMKHSITIDESTGPRRGLRFLGRMLWQVPGCFRIARWLGPSYSLRCVVFHHIADSESAFTNGLGVTISGEDFKSALSFLTKHYTPVRLQDILADSDGYRLPHRPVLVTFDDAYASVARWAAPLCHQFGVPAVFFVNAAFLDNQRLAPDNLICYVRNVMGMEKINAAARAVSGCEALELHSLAEVFGAFLPAISLAKREVFLDALRQFSGINESCMAKEAKLYMTGKQLCDLTSFDFEIGNHTYTHTHGRSLTKQDFVSEVDRNKRELEALSGTKVRSFSQPYGSSKDLTSELVGHLERSGHEAVFLSESVANSGIPDLLHFDRISTCSARDGALFSEVEVLPRLRAMRNRMFHNAAPVQIGRFHSSERRQEFLEPDEYVKISDRS
jgi:peptidoglycan/xylan/chitin deacetylase (PgdA/CDA1 family)